MTSYLTPQFDAMPTELHSLPRWVTWSAVPKAGEKDKKEPFAPDRPDSHASSTDPTTWGTKAQAEAAYLDGGRTGVGIVLNGDGLVGVDIDHCVVDGKPSPDALALLDKLGAAYIEISPSGTGLRALGYGEQLSAGVNGIKDGLKAEFYSTGRYLTLTGHTIKAGPLATFKDFAATAESFRTVKKTKTNAKTGDLEIVPPDERHAAMVEAVLSGDVYHDSLRDLAASLVATGMQPGAVVNHLRGLMDASQGAHDERWQARRGQIPDLVSSAERKFSPPGNFAGFVDPNIVAMHDFMAGKLLIEYVWQHILTKGWLYALVANPGSGKTAITLYMAVMLALGRELMGRKTKPCRVLYLCGENPQDVRLRVEVMLLAMGIAADSLNDRIFFTRRPFAIDDAKQLAGFVEDAQAHGPFDVMFIDTGPAHSQAGDENDNRAMHDLAMAMRRLMEPIGMPCTIALMHPIKNAQREDLLPRGGSSFTGSIDGVLCLWQQKKGEAVELFPHTGKFRGRQFESMWFDLNEAAHPTAKDNFGDDVLTVVAVPGERAGTVAAVDISGMFVDDIRQQMLVFVDAIEKQGEWIGTSTTGTTANNPFKKSWFVHPAYPATLVNADENMKRQTFTVIEAMIKDGLLIREKRAITPGQRQKDQRSGVWITDKGRGCLETSLETPQS